MFKLIKRIICLSIISAIAFVVISFMSGGKVFRWFGETVNKKSEQAAEKADKIKETTQNVKDTVKESTEKIRKTGAQIENVIGRGKDD
ncbi:MAG: hypothetical protein Q8J64_06765 [Thermodesulfovibrionales bacterium]|nr:hypothetical protein [Thermodesulfovibrionales bacterium]